MPSKPKHTAGARFSLLPDGTPAPSVTTILGSVESRQSQVRLENWAKNWQNENPGATSPTERGNFIDAALSAYFSVPEGNRTLPSVLGLPDDVVPFMESILKPLSATGNSILHQIGDVIWSQGFLTDKIDPSLRMFRPNVNKRLPPTEYIYSQVHRYTGTPDFVGNYTNSKGVKKFSLISLKTSNSPYSSNPPDWDKFNARKKMAAGMGEKFVPPPGWSDNYKGHAKYSRAAKQEAAYDIAFSQSFGINVEQYVILVATPEKVQSFVIDKKIQGKYWQNKWLADVEKYYQLFPQSLEIDAVDTSF
jgi:hypothetical protein